MTTMLKVDGMTCGHCVQAVTKALNAVPGVERAMVVLDSGLAEIEGEAPMADLVSAVEAEGYTASVA